MKTSRRAFTLIELLVVIAILAILASMIVSKLGGSSFKKERLACAANLKKIGQAFHMYVQENDGYAPFNPDAQDEGDNFYSWEALYLLGPYLDDSNHEKFYNGTWQTVRCPGNRCDFYPTGTRAVDQNGNPYDSSWMNRQAPENWPAESVVPPSERSKHPDNRCSPGRQVVDYQYNVSLGGTFRRWVPTLGIYAFRNYYENAGRPRRYKVDFVMRFPSEAVIFCDIQYNLALCRDQTIPGKDRYVYAYLNSGGDRQWDACGLIRPSGVADFEVGYKVMCTNQKIHGGRGINAVFYDGHVEFLYGKSCYSGDGEGSNRRMEDDLMSWGITYPRALPQPFPLDPSKKMWEIPGVHGYRRYPAGWCIVHEYDQGFGPKVTQTNKDRFGNNWGTGDCYWDGV